MLKLNRNDLALLNIWICQIRNQYKNTALVYFDIFTDFGVISSVSFQIILT